MSAAKRRKGRRRSRRDLRHYNPKRFKRGQVVWCTSCGVHPGEKCLVHLAETCGQYGWALVFHVSPSETRSRMVRITSLEALTPTMTLMTLEEGEEVSQR